jgi:hypothetical protein
MDITEIDDNAVDSSTIDSMISSPDFVAPVAAEGNADGGDAVAKGADGADKPVLDADGKTLVDADKNLEDRFDKHPRFIELNNSVKTERDARIAAEAKLSILTQSPIGEVAKPVNLPEGIKDVSKMSADEIREWIEDDPAGYTKNLLDLASYSVKSSLTNENVHASTIAAIEKTFNEYAKENPDFNGLWDDGSIPRYMQDHPGMNAISAHMKMTGDARTEAKVNAAVAKAIKETEERVTKNFQAKRNAHIIDAQAATKGADVDIDAELKDTNQAGGRDAVLARRLEQRRAGVAV